MLYNLTNIILTIF